MSDALKHIAFVLDGNRRWARKQNLSTLQGHKSGYERVKTITSLLPKYGIEYVTYYLFSMENWERTAEEVNYLLGLFRNFFSADDYVMRHGIRIKAIGNLEKLPPDVLERVRYLEDLTSANTSLTVAVAISYGGRDEVVRATQRVIRDVMENKISAVELNEEIFASYLDTASMPYPDAFVRTGEKRISNFLIWQAAYAEIFFVDKLWPDFDESDLKKIVLEFSQRERRYGK
ncbi:MAG: di-trans,poly-cis-decaprenylcistransferase [Holosporaceae bacterium]|jgi:undecaprenyl diphosphate synthase|nr:di-trans,poly-cis-decaprenylcistransferase [Holosporaceae bacterium]